MAQSDEELRLSGTIEAERSISLSFAVPGTVQEVLVSEGSTVARGQPLALLNPSSYEDALGIAGAKADQAADACRRLEPMHRNGTVPDVKWVEAQTGLREADHALSIARKNLDDAVLRAPEGGVIARRDTEPGTTAAPGVPAFLLVETDRVRAVAPLPEREVRKFRIGLGARVSVAALNRTFEGRILEIGVTADPLTRTYPVKVAVPNPDGELRVGMVADVTLREHTETPLVTVPAEAVRLDEEGKTCVYLLGDDGKVWRRPVDVLGYSGERLALTRGVAAGDRVVVSGTPMLADGIQVRALGTLGGN